ncbi:MAG: hypothetical protein P8L32_05760, partial [Paracoccaceae bacterium]|nr:hypothetical protein [Paracoccaceae bacterium]
GMFGESSVVLPGGDGPDSAAWPAHWPRFELEWNEAEEEWRKWLDDPEGYVPPEPPKELAEEAAG